MLGCTSDQWMGLHTAEGFLGWLEEHPDTGAGLYAGFGRSIGLQQLGLGSELPAELWLLSPTRQQRFSDAGRIFERRTR